jgi:isoleucyl-tRNA synthetase
LAPYADLIRDEVNIKEVRFSDDVGDAGAFVLTAKLAVAGPRLGGDVQKVIRALRAGNWDRQGDGTVVAAGIVLEPGEFELALRPADDSVSRAVSFDALVILDVAPSPELLEEGVARDVARLANEARRAAKLHVSDRVELGVDGPGDVLAACRTHQVWLAEQTLAVTVRLGESAGSTGAFVHTGSLPDGRQLTIALRVAGASAS